MLPLLRCLGLSGSVALLGITALAAQELPPQEIFLHGNILTGAHLKPGERSLTPERVEALAVRAGRVSAVGSDATIAALKGPGTVIIDLHGAFAMPGFNDAHTHMAQAGQQHLAVDLAGVTSLKQMQARVRAYVATARPGQWVLGGGWDHTLWPGRTLPTRQDLDAVTAGHPALLERVDGHIALANTAALQAAGITAQTPDPAGGRFDHAADGSLTGIVRETPALALLQKVIPRPDTATRRKALELSIQDALAHGVTSVQDFSDWDDFLVLAQMQREGRLPVRFAEWQAFDQPLALLQQRRATYPADGPLLHLTQLKAFMDGSLGSRTAAMLAPYSDDPGNSGLPRYEQAKLNQMSIDRAQAGFQLGFHAIGDRANAMALDAFQAAEDHYFASGSHQKVCPMRDAGTIWNGPPCRRRADFRFRIEHAQVVSPGDFARFRQLGVIASMQPSHLLTDMAWAGDRLGPERSKYAYAWRSFLDHGVVVAFGTDYPVESISPFRGLYSAVTRENEAGTQTFEPQERITRNQALFAYTQASPFAEFREGTKGRLEPGYLADLVVLDRDLQRIAPRELLKVRVLRTVVGGVTEYLAPAAGR